MKKQMYICIANDDKPDYTSIAYTRKESVQKEVDRANAWDLIGFDWNDLKKWGYKCKKVWVSIEDIK